MDKLGYTFYPKDWWTSDTFFKLPPELRYLYLEIISMMYVNDGTWRASRTELYRRFGVDPMEKGWEVLQDLFIVTDGIWSHPSVNKRLARALASKKNGQLGGRPSKEPTKPNSETYENPPSEDKGKGNIKLKAKENETQTDWLEEWIFWGNQIVKKEDQYWEQMKGRQVSQEEMDSFLSVAARNDWKMESQGAFRLTLKGFDVKKFDKVTPDLTKIKRNIDAL